MVQQRGRADTTNNDRPKSCLRQRDQCCPAWYNWNISDDQYDTPEWLDNKQIPQDIQVNRMLIQRPHESLDDDMSTVSGDSNYDSLPDLVPRRTADSNDSSTSSNDDQTPISGQFTLDDIHHIIGQTKTLDKSTSSLTN